MAITKGYQIMALAKKAENGKSEPNELGIMSGHAYPILDNWPGKKVKLKSNYGKIKGFEFNNVKKTFVMNMKDLHHNFPFVVICKLHQGFTYSACPMKSSMGIGEDKETLNYVCMKVSNDTHAYITLHQRD